MNKFLMTLIDGSTVEVSFPDDLSLQQVRAWLNESMPFCSVGGKAIVNLRHVVKLEPIYEPQEG